MQIQFNITLNEDNEAIQMANGTDAGRIVLDKFELWLPKLIPKDSVYSNFVSSFMKESKWKYLRELYEVSQPTQTSGYFQISANIKEKHFIKVIHQIGRKKYSQLIKSNTLIQSLTH